MAAVWQHEFQHYQNGRAELMKLENNLYFQVEGLVRKTYDDILAVLVPAHKDSQDRLRAAAGHENISGNWSGSFWIWKTHTDNFFVPTAPRTF